MDTGKELTKIMIHHVSNYLRDEAINKKDKESLKAVMSLWIALGKDVFHEFAPKFKKENTCPLREGQVFAITTSEKPTLRLYNKKIKSLNTYVTYNHFCDLEFYQVSKIARKYVYCEGMYHEIVNTCEGEIYVKVYPDITGASRRHLIKFEKKVLPVDVNTLFESYLKEKKQYFHLIKNGIFQHFDVKSYESEFAWKKHVDSCYLHCDTAPAQSQAPKPEKKLSAYSLFISSTVKQIKEEFPEMTTRDRMRRAAELWQEQKNA